MGNVVQLPLDMSETASSAENDVPRYIDFPERFEPGQRIHCILYGGKDGTIVAVHGEQRPDSIRTISALGMTSGGNAEIDIAWDTCGDRGGFSRRTPECIVRGVQWKMLSGYKEPAKAIAEAETYLAKKEAEAKAAKERFEKAKIKVEKMYPFLTKDTGSDRNIIQKNMRAFLKHKFPKVKFRVLKESYNCRNVYWEDGPTKEEVEKVTNLFDTGTFDPYTDYHGTERTPFSEVFGGCQFVFTNREFSDDFISKAIDAVWAEYKTSFEEYSKPTVEDYRRGRTHSLRNENWNNSFSELLWEYMSKH